MNHFKREVWIMIFVFDGGFAILGLLLMWLITIILNVL